VIRRFYVHNYRCLENFELPTSGQSSLLLIGKNGSGKTTVGLALWILRKIARGTNRVDKLVKPNDLARGRRDAPVRFEIQTELEGRLYEYVIALELPKNFKELRILEENLIVDGAPVYTREQAQVHLLRAGQQHRREAMFRVDWHLVALPIIQELSHTDPLSIFKRWLARILILRPTPSLIKGDSDYEISVPLPSVKNFGAWFSHLLSDAPATYARIDEYLKQVMPDLRNIKNPLIGTDSRSLEVEFADAQGSLLIPFQDLADGEKCLMICALVLAARQAYGPTVCFWDEPDNYLAPDEVGHAVLALRRAFDSGGQFIATSHNPEAIRRFSDDNTLVMHRRSHLEPVTVRSLRELQLNGDLVGALITGDLVP
jgi:predicted ATPase